jgi:hypothetical protein
MTSFHTLIRGRIVRVGKVGKHVVPLTLASLLVFVLVSDETAVVRAVVLNVSLVISALIQRIVPPGVRAWVRVV